MGKSDPKDKSFEISKRLVWEAYKSVKANKGAAGVDGQSIEEFETDLENNLYRIWNRMSSGTYFPPPVRAVEIPKPHGGGTRILGIPTVGDRIARSCSPGAGEFSGCCVMVVSTGLARRCMGHGRRSVAVFA